MIIDESEVEIKKFKMFAENANTEKQVIDLCKKYLKHKGIDIDVNAAYAEMFKPKEPEKIYVGLTDIIRVQGQVSLDEYSFRDPTHEMDCMIHARKHIVENITHELVKSDMIEFVSFKDIARYQTVVRGNLNVYKDSRKK